MTLPEYNEKIDNLFNICRPYIVFSEEVLVGSRIVQKPELLSEAPKEVVKAWAEHQKLVDEVHKFLFDI